MPVFAVLWLLTMTIAALFYAFASWVKPWVVDHANRPFGPGADRTVPWREMWLRSRWRYDSWLDRALSLMLLVMLMLFWILAFTAV